MRRTRKKREKQVIRFPRDRRAPLHANPAADPHPEWPIHLTETRAYHNEPRNPYQSDDEDSAQAFVQRYLELADIAMAHPIEKEKELEADEEAA